MMKKYIILIPLLFVLCSLSVAAAPAERDTVTVPGVSEVDSAVYEKGKEMTSAAGVPDKNDTPKAVSKSKLSESSMIGYSLSFGAILFTLFIFLFLKKKITESEKRIDRIKEKVTGVIYKMERAELQDQNALSQAQIIALIKREAKDLEEKIEALKEKNESSAAVETVSTPSESEGSPVFVSKILYGGYSFHAKGIPSEELKPTKREEDTFKIETLSATTAKVFIVDGLSPTQFSVLLQQKVVEVREGNQITYQNISVVEPGRAVLDGDIWKITNTIKVNLS